MKTHLSMYELDRDVLHLSMDALSKGEEKDSLERR